MWEKEVISQWHLSWFHGVTVTWLHFPIDHSSSTQIMVWPPRHRRETQERSHFAGSQCEELRPWQRSWGRRLGICKGGIEPQETPCSRASTPKTRVCLVYCCMSSPTPLTLWGGLSPTTSLAEGVNLQLQLTKIPGHDKSVSTYKLLWRFSSLPEQVHLATCDCSQPPNCERHEML